MATSLTTLRLQGDMIHLSVNSTPAGNILVETPFTNPANYWLARITPPAHDQRHDAYHSTARREFERRYINALGGRPRYEIDVKDLSYGFAYEFGGDRVTNGTHFPARVYAVYLGTNGTGTVADFRVYPSAAVAMQAERDMREVPGQVVTPAQTIPSGLRPLPESLSTRMDTLYAEIAATCNTLAVLERRLKEAGYAPVDVHDTSRNGILRDATKRGTDYGEKAWVEKFLPVVRYEEAMRRVQDASVPTPAPQAQPVATSPVAPPASLLDAIAEEHEAVVPTPTPVPGPGLTTPASELKKLRGGRPAPAKPARKPAASPAGSFPRPSTIPAPAGDDLPF